MGARVPPGDYTARGVAVRGAAGGRLQGGPSAADVHGSPSGALRVPGPDHAAGRATFR